MSSPRDTRVINPRGAVSDVGSTFQCIWTVQLTPHPAIRSRPWSVGLAVTPLEANTGKRRRRRPSAALAPSRRARLPPAAPTPVLVGAGSHPSTPPCLHIGCLKDHTCLLALLICFPAVACSLPTAVPEDGVEMPGEGTFSAVPRMAGLVGFDPPLEMRRIGYVIMCSLSIAFCSWLEIDWLCVVAGGRSVICAAVSFRPCIDIHKVCKNGAFSLFS
jgi:hypothetical protein